mmetsp:Transcript_8609/g.27448  ORF Transcript_8609/g.27448 Transcript_8609/m.27448 type:complete len:238 (+) Transcript_8609:97-810(+)
MLGPKMPGQGSKGSHRARQATQAKTQAIEGTTAAAAAAAVGLKAARVRSGTERAEAPASWKRVKRSGTREGRWREFGQSVVDRGDDPWCGKEIAGGGGEAACARLFGPPDSRKAGPSIGGGCATAAVEASSDLVALRGGGGGGGSGLAASAEGASRAGGGGAIGVGSRLRRLAELPTGPSVVPDSRSAMTVVRTSSERSMSCFPSSFTYCSRPAMSSLTFWWAFCSSAKSSRPLETS